MFNFLKRIFRREPLPESECVPRPNPESLRDTMSRGATPAIERKPIIDPFESRRPSSESLRKTMMRGATTSARQEGKFKAVLGGNSSGPSFSTIGIDYCDTNGDDTRRVVTVRGFTNEPDQPTIMVAFCHLRRELRHFRLDRIESFFDPETGEVLTHFTLDAHHGPMPSPQLAQLSPEPKPPASLAEIFELYSEHLAVSGWIPKLETTETGGEALRCYHLGKRGKPLKYPPIEMAFEPTNYDHVISTDGQIVAQPVGPRRRPWSVRAFNRPTRTWGSIAPAFKAFAEAAGLTLSD
jgi:hypothetical protein